MVIGPGRSGISAFVILADGEYIPKKFNDERVVVMRRGASTNFELLVVKGFGKLASPELILPPEALLCEHPKSGDPLHEHADGTWWFYDITWVAEAGPFLTYEDAYAGLKSYCILYQKEQEKGLTTEPKDDTVEEK
jgi:hypothetical protein